VVRCYNIRSSAANGNGSDDNWPVIGSFRRLRHFAHGHFADKFFLRESFKVFENKFLCPILNVRHEVDNRILSTCKFKGHPVKKSAFDNSM
jgi:hypothetical protein